MIALRVSIYIVVFIYATTLFFPKSSFVDYINKEYANRENVELKLELQNSIKGLVASNAVALYNNNTVAKIEKVSILPAIFYNQIVAENIKLQGLLGSFVPPKIEYAKAHYALYAPTKIIFTVKGDVGKVDGKLDLANKTLVLELEPSALMKKTYGFILNKATKKQESKFIYEYAL